MLNDIKQTCVRASASTLRVVMPLIKRGAELITLVWAVGLTTHMSLWATDYADRALGMKEATEAGVALIIGAVLGPLLSFTGYIVKKYLEGTGNGNGHNETPKV